MRQTVLELYVVSAHTASVCRRYWLGSRKIGIMATSLLIGAVSSPALAITENNKVITHVGSQSNGLVYVNFTVPPAGGCSYDNLYLNISTDAGKALYAVLLTAYSQGHALSRVDYTNISGTCYVDIFEM